MNLPILYISSGDVQLDRLTQALLAQLLTAFPSRIHSAYFEGSCADQAITPLSDLDLTLVFHSVATAAEQSQLAALLAEFKRHSPRSLDVQLTDRQTLLRADQLAFQTDARPVLRAVTLKHASAHLYGPDLRPAIPAVPQAVYRRTYAHFPFLVLHGQRQQPDQLSYPLSAPEPAADFLGYTGKQLRDPIGALVPSTKRLIHASGFIATALLALGTPYIVADKRTAIALYATAIGGPWATHLAAVHTCCRVQWGYRVPERPADQQILRDLCQQQLAFENAFVARYLAFLAAEARDGDPAVRAFAAARRAQIAVTR